MFILLKFQSISGYENLTQETFFNGTPVSQELAVLGFLLDYQYYVRAIWHMSIFNEELVGKSILLVLEVIPRN
jgi:hypothetical protein